MALGGGFDFILGPAAQLISTRRWPKQATDLGEGKLGVNLGPVAAGPVGPVIPAGANQLFNGDGKNTGKIDFWIIAGQSNTLNAQWMVATIDRVFNARLLMMYNPRGGAAAISPLIGNVYYAAEPFEDDGTSQRSGSDNLVGPSRMGFAKSFGETLLVQASGELGGRPVLLKRYSLGGTGFYNQIQPSWTPGITTATALYDKMIVDVKFLLKQNPELQLRGILWHQGEEDSGQVQVKYKSQTANWTVLAPLLSAEVVTGATSGATGKIVSQIDNGTTGTIFIVGNTGTFVDGENLTGSKGGAAVCDGGQTTVPDADYNAMIAAFVAKCRLDLKTPDLPFIFGAMSPDLASMNHIGDLQLAFPNSIAWTGAMSPRLNGQSNYPGDTSNAVIGINDEAGLADGTPAEGVYQTYQDTTHFSATSQRKIGPRYVKAWLASLTNNNPGGTPATPAVPDAVADLAGTVDDGIITLTFTPPNNNGAVISGYDAQISPTGAGTWTDAPKRFCGNGRDLAGLTNGVAIDVRIRARNKVGAGAWSNTLSNKTPAIQFEAEATAAIAAMTSAPNAAMQAAINRFIKGAKNATLYVANVPTATNLWSRLDQFLCYGLNVQQSSLVDLATPARVGTVTGAPVFTAKVGVQAALATDRIGTGYNPGDGGSYNLKQSSALLGCVVLTDSQSSLQDIGSATLSLGIYARRATDDIRALLNDTSGTGIANTNAIGRYIAVRRTGAGTVKEIYKNGASLGTVTQASSAVANAEMKGLGGSGNGTLRGLFCQFAGSEMSAAEIAAFDALLAQFQADIAAS